MIIEKQRVGAHGKTTVYTLCNSIADTGAERPEEIARFDKLETAVIVLRYMRGDSLSESEEYRAKEAIKKADAPTDESKRDRKAAKPRPLCPIIARAAAAFKKGIITHEN